MITILRKPSARILLVYAVTLLFIVLNGWMIVKKQTMLAATLPALFAIVLLAIYSLDKVLLLTVFLTPLSLPLHAVMPHLSFDMFLPTEPLLFGVLLLFLMKFAAGYRPDKKVMLHPVTLTIALYLGWMFITSLTSTMPVVSLKFFLVKVWFITGFYILAIPLFAEKTNIRRFVWLYTAALLLVIGYTIGRHLGYGLMDQQAAHFVMNPFYKDHTSYGAALAMFLPFITLFVFHAIQRPLFRWIAGGVLAILLLAFVLSYTRAAWLSLFLALGVWVMLKLRIKFKTLLLTLATLLVVVVVFQQQIVSYLERNDEESSSDLMEHFTSMSNITTDASNLERINRWSCALRMFNDRPVFGFGPGTYMFKYAPYQLTKDRTIISTNAGDAGNAHSEYLGPLAESGLLGMLSFLLLAGTILYVAFRAYSRVRDKEMKVYLTGALLGLITYLGHGFMNNFLDTDKASVPFWGFTAMIVTIDLWSRRHPEESQT
ncbi:MAG TPA: O-antigen ligase family protein [Prolixibacteraceae bacterium]|nr:O-antigen ligase family protein [Prolixibacteraceae bacterium]